MRTIYHVVLGEDHVADLDICEMSGEVLWEDYSSTTPNPGSFLNVVDWAKACEAQNQWIDKPLDEFMAKMEKLGYTFEEAL